MFILGDSGAGKSTFSTRLEQGRWDAYKAGGRIPLFIDLKAVHNLDQDLIQQHLASLSMFSASHMKNLSSRGFIVICDGYDECQSRSNLYTNNQFNKPNQWKTKMIISCRTQYLTPEYRAYFAPQQDEISNLGLSPTELFTEAVIVPFKVDQIKEYIAQYTAITDASDNRPISEPRWTNDHYMERLEKIANVMDLIKNPFMLRMVLDILPKIAPTTTEITLFSSTTNLWICITKTSRSG